MSRIALIGMSVLECSGIAYILRESMNSEVYASTLVIYSTTEEFNSDSEKSDCFIVDISAFVNNLEYFMPRRNRLIIACRENRTTPFNCIKDKDSDIRMIYRNSGREEILEKIIDILKDPLKEKENTSDISMREREVLRELASGKTNKEIADSLCISVNTVITHRKNLSAKLGIKTVSGLSLYAIMNGII